MQYDLPLGILEDADRLVVSEAVETGIVDGQDLIASFQLAILGCGALVEHSLDVDGKISVRTAVASDDAETEARASSFQRYHLQLGLGRLCTLPTAVKENV